MASHPSGSYTLKTSSARPTPCVPSTAIVRTLCVATVISVLVHVLHSSFRSVAGGATLLCLAASVCAPRLPSYLWLFVSFPFHVPVLAFYLGLATWVQPSHPASPRPSSVSGANLVLTHRLLSSLALSAAVRQFWCHDRWCERSDLWIQLTVHRQHHRLCR